MELEKSNLVLKSGNFCPKKSNNRTQQLIILIKKKNSKQNPNTSHIKEQISNDK